MKQYWSWLSYHTYLSNQITAFKSKWFVGSSSMRRVGSIKRALQTKCFIIGIERLVFFTFQQPLTVVKVVHIYQTANCQVNIYYHSAQSMFVIYCSLQLQQYLDHFYIHYLASDTLILHPPEKWLTGLCCISVVNPRPL